MAVLAKCALGLLVLGAVGCGGNDFDEVSAVQGVRVLAVRAQAAPDGDGGGPASGAPGETLMLEMLHTDGRVPLQSASDTGTEGLERVWLGGCHNPPSRFYYGCGPNLEAALANGAPTEDVPGIYGTQATFTLPLPEDILTSAPFLETDPIHFGVSFVFFGVCAGKIVPNPGRTDGVPFDCQDTSGTQLGARDFVFGFTTLYTYEGVTNLNPSLAAVLFDGNPVMGEGCGVPGSCPTVVPACAAGEDCPEHPIAPEISSDSFEHLPDGTHEILWASYYATQGGIVQESQLVSDRSTGKVADFTSGWRAPSTPGRVRLWVTVNDERGGAAWGSFDIEVK